MDQILRRKRSRRALTALEDYDRGLEDVLRLLPEADGELNGPAVAPVLQDQVGEGLNFRILRLRRKSRSIPLRAIVSAEIGRLNSRRAVIEGGYVESAWYAIRQVRSPWELIRGLWIRGFRAASSARRS